MVGSPKLRLWFFQDKEKKNRRHIAAINLEEAFSQWKKDVSDSSECMAEEVTLPNHDIHLMTKRNPHLYLKGLGPRTVHFDPGLNCHYINLYGMRQVVTKTIDGGWELIGKSLPSRNARIIKGGK